MVIWMKLKVFSSLIRYEIKVDLRAMNSVLRKTTISIGIHRM